MSPDVSPLDVAKDVEALAKEMYRLRDLLEPFAQMYARSICLEDSWHRMVLRTFIGKARRGMGR